MKDQSSFALLSSVSFTLILCGIFSLFIDSQFLNNFILGICFFTLMYSYSDFFKKEFLSFLFKLFSIPVAFIVTILILFADLDAAYLNRINNFSTLITLGITIFLIAERQAVSDRELLQEILDLKKETNQSKSNDPKD